MTQLKEVQGDWEEKADVVEHKINTEHRDWTPVITNGATVDESHNAENQFEVSGKPRDYEVERNENHAVVITPSGQWLDRTEHIKITDETNVTLHKN